MNDLIEKKTYCGRKFEYLGKEYMRIDGVWFAWENDCFTILKNSKLEQIYQEQFGESV